MNDSSYKPTRFLTAVSLLLISTTIGASEPISVGHPTNQSSYRIQDVDVNMTESEYRKTFRSNRGEIRDFIEDYSESSLASLGIPRKGVRVLGAVAGAAVTQDAKLYLNSSKLLAIEVKDAAVDDRSIYFGFELDW